MKYLSKTKYEFDGDLKVSGGALGGVNVDSTLEIEFPQMVVAHFYHELNDQFAILAQADWEDWSSFEDIPLSTSTGAGGGHPTELEGYVQIGGRDSL